MRDLVIGSRGSQLALWQAEHLRTHLGTLHPSLTIRIEVIKTLGDHVLDTPLSMVGDKGLFTKEIEHALLERRIDIAVHSLKDLPTTIPEGLILGAVSKREDPRDALIARSGSRLRSLGESPRGASIATGSLRRTSQLLSIRPDLHLVDVRGNLNTRLAKLDASTWEGMILAVAGVKRLGWDDRITEIVPTETILPAVGQGALGIEVRQDDTEVRGLLSEFHDLSAFDAVTAERAFLRRVEGGCQIPVGAYATIDGTECLLEAYIGSLDGKKSIRRSKQGSRNDAASLGVMLADAMLAAGGKEILDEIRASA